MLIVSFISYLQAVANMSLFHLYLNINYTGILINAERNANANNKEHSGLLNARLFNQPRRYCGL